MAPTPFEEATAITALSSHTYSAVFPDDWCIGNVPHGGFVTSCFLRTAALHFTTTLSSQSQPQCITLHLDFLRRTQAGPATFTVQDTKLGRQTSVIHITLSQDGRAEVVGYITHSDLASESGLSVPTNFALSPAPAPVDLAKLGADEDGNWGREMVVYSGFRKAQVHADYFYPRSRVEKERQVYFGFADEWIRRSDGERWGRESLGYVVDTFPLPVDTWLRENKHSIERQENDGVESKGKEENGRVAKYWYPTLLLNLDVKKMLPDEGVEWLFVRVRAKQIQNGRMDLEVVVLDEQGDLVALSHHVSFVLSSERNTAARRVEGQSKI